MIKYLFFVAMLGNIYAADKLDNVFELSKIPSSSSTFDLKVDVAPTQEGLKVHEAQKKSSPGRSPRKVSPRSPQALINQPLRRSAKAGSPRKSKDLAIRGPAETKGIFTGKGEFTSAPKKRSPSFVNVKIQPPVVKEQTLVHTLKAELITALKEVDKTSHTIINPKG